MKLKYIPIHTPKVIDIKEENVSSVYSGTPHKCMCGCSGTYYYTSVNKEYSSKNRGYEVTNDEVNNKMVRKVLNIFRDFNGDIEGIDDYIFTIIVSPTRQYTIYLKKD